MSHSIFQFFGILAGLEGPGRLLVWLGVLLAVVVATAAIARLAHWLGPALRPTSTVLAVLLGGAAVMLLSDQGAEIGEALLDDGWRIPVLFILSVTFWAWQSWFWARAALNLKFTPHRRLWPRPGPITWLPRIYGGAVYAIALLVIVAAISPASEDMWRLGLVGAGVGAAGLLSMAAFAGRERLWLRARAGVLHRQRPLGRMVRQLARLPSPAAWRRIAVVYPFANLHIAISLAMLVVFVFWAGWYPVEVGRRFGAVALAFLAFGTWVSVLAMLQMMRPRHSLSLIAILVTVSIAGSWTRHYHRIRTVESPFESVPFSFDEAARRWAAAVGAGHDKPAVPILFVATAGGGLRAAYWTADILTSLNRDYPGFYDHLFAVSGVSGGSLGAVVSQVVVSAERQGLLTLSAGRAKALAALSQDYLAPVIAAGIYTDLVASVLPDVFRFGGRGTALENAWTASLEIDGKYPLDQPFLDIWTPVEKHGWLPILLLNATHEETGKRVITSNVRVDNWPFADAMDLHGALGHDLRVSTAAHNSARFSWVSPAGTILDSSGVQRGHVLDGGYFENYGALTLLETVEGLRKTLADVALRPIIIQISSDPELGTGDVAGADEDRSCPPRDPKPLQWSEESASLWALANEPLAPLGGLYETREARGIHASKLLARWGSCVASEDRDLNDPVYVHLRMCDAQHPAPLGWLMAAHTRKDLEELLKPDGCNAFELQRLRTALAPLAGRPVAAAL